MQERNQLPGGDSLHLQQEGPGLPARLCPMPPGDSTTVIPPLGLTLFIYFLRRARGVTVEVPMALIQSVLELRQRRTFPGKECVLCPRDMPHLHLGLEVRGKSSDPDIHTQCELGVQKPHYGAGNQRPGWGETGAVPFPAGEDTGAHGQGWKDLVKSQ